MWGGKGDLQKGYEALRVNNRKWWKGKEKREMKIDVLWTGRCWANGRGWKGKKQEEEEEMGTVDGQLRDGRRKMKGSKI